jgi:D-alanine-D-alanine ligase
MSQAGKSQKTTEKTKVAVFFGGRSPEHDVSVVTGLQVLKAIDRTRIDPFPVYITPDGVWLTGDVLRDRASYILDKTTRDRTVEVTLDVSGPRLLPKKSGMFGGAKPIEFDIAIPSFHGLNGEDGTIQGLFELAGVPYAGVRMMASGIFMDKVVAKYLFRALGIPTLPFAVLTKPVSGYLIPRGEIEKIVKDIGYPCIVKPVHLGSSIGVAKADNIEEIEASLPAIFEYDTHAIVEPFVPNLVEYNVAVGRFSGALRTSAIERPKAQSELLDFKQKYLSGGDNKSGSKNPGEISQGMLSLTRELNPKLDAPLEANIRTWVKTLFDSVGGTGAPRIDFLANKKTNEIWMNEVNPWPGSIGYFLWEAAEDPVLFTDLLSQLIDEGLNCSKRTKLPRDPVPVDARLFRRPL